MINLLAGDALTRLRELPDGFVQCVVTSPPYFGLRDYGVAGQIGAEATPDDFVAALVNVFREVRRVLRPDGILWLNLGDSYAGSATGGFRPGSGRADGVVDIRGQRNRNGNVCPPGVKPKDLLMIPARVALALQDDDWYLRSDIIWAKPNPMPESIRDRPTSSYEHIFMLTRSERYFYDAHAVKEKAIVQGWDDGTRTFGGVNKHGANLSHGSRTTGRVAGTRKELRNDTENRHRASVPGGQSMQAAPDGTRNIRNVWTITTQPFKGSHFAVFPQEIPRRCIAASTSECGGCAACGAPFKRVLEKGEPDVEQQRRSGGDASGHYAGQSTKDHDAAGVQNASDVKRRILAGMVAKRTIAWEPTCKCPDACPVPQTVLDPFSGAGTTAMVANRLGRDAIGIELNTEYVEMTRNRIVADDPRVQLVIS